MEELIGFTQAQFSQIVMLPQGEFRKFLTSDTENKETIMRKIFKTEPYRELVERLKAKKDDAQSQLLKEMHKSEGHIQQIPTLLPERESSIFNVLDSKHYNVNQVVQGLEEERSFYEEKTVLDKKNYEDVYAEHTKMQEAFHTAKNVNERFTELQQKEAVLKELVTKLPMIERKEQQLAEAERAVTIEEIERQLTALQEEEVGKTDNLNNASAAVRMAEEQMEFAKNRFQAEVGRKEEREKLTEMLFRLQDHLPAVSSLAAKENALDLLKKELKHLEKELLTAEQKTAEETAKFKDIVSKIETLEGRLGSYDERIDQLNGLNEKCRVLDESVELQKRIVGLKTVQHTKEVFYRACKADYEELEQKWFKNQAAILAETLNEGDACPVCGSEHHPVKSHEQIEEAVSKEQLENEKKRLSEAENHYRTAIINSQNAEQQLDEKSKEMVRLHIDVADNDLHELKKKLEIEVSNLRIDRKNLAELKVQIEGTRSNYSSSCCHEF